MTSFKHFGFFALFACWLAAGPSAAAETSPVDSATLERVGFGGRFKVGKWTPLTARVQTHRACRLQLEIEAPDPDGNRAVWRDEFSIPEAGTHEVTALFQTGWLKTTLRVRIKAKDLEGEQTWTIPVKAGEGPAAQLTQTALTHAVLLVGTLGNPGGLKDTAGAATESAKPAQTAGAEMPIRVVSLNDPSQLILSPSDGHSRPFANATGLEALDAVVISGQYAMKPAAATALKNWVTLGGHLILSVGRNLDAYRNSPLSQWISGESEAAGEAAFRITGVTRHRDLSSLETFAGKSEPLMIHRQNPVPGVRIEAGNNAQVLVSVRSGPLIVRAPYGLGTVTMIGVDLDREPIQSWPALPLTMRNLLLQQKHPEEKRAAIREQSVGLQRDWRVRDADSNRLAPVPHRRSPFHLGDYRDDVRVSPRDRTAGLFPRASCVQAAAVDVDHVSRVGGGDGGVIRVGGPHPQWGHAHHQPVGRAGF